MFVTLHSAIGAGAGLALFPGNWPAAFLLGWLGHYLFDAVPHGDDSDDEMKADWKRWVRRAALWGGADLTLLGLICLAWISRHGWSWVFAAAVLGSCLPDLMWGFAAIVGQREMFGLFGRLHHRIHNPLKIMLPLWLGLSLQLLTAALIWYNLF
jgi:hypothetical protein